MKKTISSEELSVLIRIEAWRMAFKAKASHMGGNFSMADILAVLYHDVLRYQSNNPSWEKRDRVVLSKGHCCAVLYACLAECGFFKKELLSDYGMDGSVLSCHVSKKVPGVELSSGSLGHGAPVAVGMALSALLQGKNYRVFAICGDGELNEGSIWEMIMFAGHHKIHNYTLIVDANKMQAMGDTKDIIDLEPISDKFRDFGWFVVDVNGHDHDQLRTAFFSDSKGKPKVIIAHTIKGHGVSFMENSLWWHYQVPYDHFYLDALKELEAKK